MAAERSRNFRRIGLQFAFWAVLGILLLTILQNFINISQSTQLSAYDDDWDDMSAFREDINDMGVETKSLVSSPLLLADIEDPRVQELADEIIKAQRREIAEMKQLISELE